LIRMTLLMDGNFTEQINRHRLPLKKNHNSFAFSAPFGHSAIKNPAAVRKGPQTREPSGAVRGNATYWKEGG
jgi:hypothetical protein